VIRASASTTQITGIVWTLYTESAPTAMRGITSCVRPSAGALRVASPMVNAFKTYYQSGQHESVVICIVVPYEQYKLHGWRKGPELYNGYTR